MKFKILIILSVVISAFITSCNNSDVTVVGNWVFKGHLESVGRADGTSFAIGDYGYWGMGKDDEDFLTDFWKYDPSKNLWSIAANFPGTARAFNISISNGEKGYVGLGYDGDVDLNDFWEYDPAADSWTKLPDFPGGARRMATAFAIGSDIYVGTGYDSKNKMYLNDFYKYSGGKWEKIFGYTGEKRYGAQSIGFNGKGYIISGYHSGIIQEFHEYDPATNTWKELPKLSNVDDGGNISVARYNGSVFASESKLYLVSGTSSVSGASLASCYEWDPKSQDWTEKSEIESSAAREGAGCFVIGGYGYLVGGRRGSLYLDDCVKFEPSIEKNTDD